MHHRMSGPDIWPFPHCTGNDQPNISAYCNMYTCSGNCIQEQSAGFRVFGLITLLTLTSLNVLQPWSYIKTW